MVSLAMIAVGKSKTGTSFGVTLLVLVHLGYCAYEVVVTL